MDASCGRQGCFAKRLVDCHFFYFSYHFTFVFRPVTSCSPVENPEEKASQHTSVQTIGILVAPSLAKSLADSTRLFCGTRASGIDATWKAQLKMYFFDFRTWPFPLLISSSNSLLVVILHCKPVSWQAQPVQIEGTPILILRELEFVTPELLGENQLTHICRLFSPLSFNVRYQ